jgi:hypothetical protein
MPYRRDTAVVVRNEHGDLTNVRIVKRSPGNPPRYVVTSRHGTTVVGESDILGTVPSLSTNGKG